VFLCKKGYSEINVAQVIDEMMPTDLNEWIEIGRIVSPQGLKGEMRVYPDSDFPERFMTPGERWLLRPGAKQPESVQLQSGRFLDGKGLYVIRIEGIETISQAEFLRGAKLMVQVGDRPLLAADEFHVMDLVGLTVINANTQAVMGIAAAGNDLLEISLQNSPGQTVLVPLVKEFVKSLDLQSRQIELLPIPGLIPDV
jgi:16S rRNA processing protein RimM